VSNRFGVSAHSLYGWRKTYASDVSKGGDQADEIRQLKRDLARITEERDILKEADPYFTKDLK
jgi:transposase